MTGESIDVLLVEDNSQEAEIVRLYLAKRYSRAYTIRHLKTIASALDELSIGTLPSVILLDLHLPDAKGLDGFERIARLAPGVPIIILTNFNEEKTAAQAVRAGAQDYLVKREVNAALLHRAILYAIERQRSERALIKAKERYALAATGANDCIWDWEAETGTGFTFDDYDAGSFTASLEEALAVADRVGYPVLVRPSFVIGGLAIVSLAFVGPQTPWAWLGLIPVATGLIGWCPPYSLLGINTCSVKK